MKFRDSSLEIYEKRSCNRPISFHQSSVWEKNFILKRNFAKSSPRNYFINFQTFPCNFPRHFLLNVYGDPAYASVLWDKSQLIFSCSKSNNRNTRKRCKTSLKLRTKTPQRRQWRRSGVFIVNFEHISHLLLLFLLLTLIKQMLAAILDRTFRGFFTFYHVRIFSTYACTF